MKQCEFNDCKAVNNGSSGGALWTKFDSSRLTINDSSFIRCTCTQNGGAIAQVQLRNDGGIGLCNVTFTECKTIAGSISQNFGWGGGIYIFVKYSTDPNM
ncbi:MAG: hypothetical protein EZS28_047053 [Streblomastix strix]|uniref:Right handed beta helix domain-containing protein n=1 Tax=Streblomastix strix TaxID=222440 RepID=A0A5J4TIQ9_9EUKA|nr:MAG: hypothetical protein EZS28_047053 [Streblomastix strix]